MGHWLSHVMASVPPAVAYAVVAVLATAEALFLGLGLPGTKRLVSEFAIESVVGKGTTVTVTKWKNG